MKLPITVVALTTGWAFASPVVVFSDDFNSENGGVGQLNYSSFAHWTVADGTVDLIGNGYFDFFPTQGLFVDLDGSTGNAGSLTKTTAITYELGKSYTLTFKLAGNQRGGSDDSVQIDIGIGTLLTDTLVLSPLDPLVTHTYTFIGDGSTDSISFENAGGDNVGAILDDVLLTVIPLPSASALAGLGLLGLGVRRRRGSL